MQKRIIPYNKGLKDKARYLRKNSTPGEIILWTKLKKRQMLGYKFNRQRPLYNYIMDFFCEELMLAIEIDGSSHFGKWTYDLQRQKFLENKGVVFLRFFESEVKDDVKDVLYRIESWILTNR